VTPNSRLRVIDIETTGMEPPAEIIEFGRVDVVSSGTGSVIEPPMSRLYRPLLGIPPETMAVHHICEDDFDAGTPVCSPDRLRLAVWGGRSPDILVAHNCDFERKFITAEITEALPWICTYKAALRVWPEAPKHSNQVLRYWLGLKLDKSLAMPPHRAAPDAWVTAALLNELLKKASIPDLIKWTSEPKLLPTVPKGKHSGMPWSEPPPDYLSWVISQKDMDPDIKWNAEQELARRARFRE